MVLRCAAYGIENRERGSCTREKSGHKRELLRKKEDSQKRAMCEEENTEEGAKCCRI